MAFKTGRIRIKQKDGSYKWVETTYDDSDTDIAEMIQPIETKTTVKTSQKKKSSNPILDILTGAGKTIANTSTILGEGILKGLEGFTDLGQSAVGNIAGALGNKELKNDIKELVKRDATADVMSVLGWDDRTKRIMDENSAIKRTNLGGEIVQSLGTQIPSYLLGTGIAKGVTSVAGGLANATKTGSLVNNLATAVNTGKYANTITNVATTGAFGASAYGSSMEEALNEGASYEEANKYALLSSAKEIATEWITGGIPGLKGSGLDNVVAKKMGMKSIDEASKTLSKAILKAGYQAVGEGAEEALSEVLTPIIKNATYSKDEKVNWEDVVHSSIVGGISGGILNAPVTIADFNNAINTRKGNVTTKTGYTSQEQQVADSLIEKNYNEQVKENMSKKEKERLRSKIETEVNEDLQNGLIDTDYIEEVLGDDKYKQYKEALDRKTNIENRQKELNSKNIAQMSLGEYNNSTNEVQSLQNELNNLNLDSMKNDLSKYVSEKTKNDSMLQLSYQEKGKRSQNFTYEINDNDSDYKKVLYEDASKSINDTKNSHNLVDLLSKTAEDMKTYIRIVNSQQLKEMGYNAKENTFINGVKTKDGNILINIDSPKALNKILGHETTHLFENTKEYQILQNAVFEYAKTKGDYDGRLKDLTDVYSNTNADINNELTADLIGDYLFTDEEFIKNLSAKQPNIFQKIYDKVKHLCKMATAGSKELRQLEKVKYSFEQAYRSQNKQSSTDTKFGIQKKQNNAFSKQVDEVFNGTFPKDSMLTVSENTPQILQDIGLKNLPITLTQRHLKTVTNSSGEYKGANYHNLGIDLVKQLPDAIAKPLNILKSDTQADSIVVVTELADKQERPVIASIKIDGKGTINNIEIDTNVLTSAYGRNNYDKFMKNNIAKGNLLYDIDEGIIKRSDGKLQLRPTTSTTDNISHSNENVKLPSVDSMQQKQNNTQEVEDTSFSLSDIEENNVNENLKQQPIMQQLSENLDNKTNNIKEIQETLTNNAKPNKVLNPNEISKLKLEDANTTPQISNVTVETGDKESSFYSNIRDKVNMLSEDSKAKILSEDEVKYYKGVTNEESLKQAYQKIADGGRNETLDWFRKDSENATSIDVAEGWILMKQYEEAGDHNGMVQVAKKMRDMGTKAGQTVQAFNIMNRMTPEGMVMYAQSELSEAYEKMVKNKTQKWIDKYREDFNLKPEETQFILNTMNEIKDMEDGYDKKVKLAEIQKIMTDKLPPEKGQGIKAWMRISMLFNTKTQVRNVLGNAIISPVNMVGDVFASATDRMIAKKTGVRTTGTTSLKSYAKGFGKGLYQSYNDFKKGINTRNIEGNRFEISEGKSFKDNTVIGHKLNQVDSLLSFMLDGGDRAFYEATFTNSINNQLVLNKTDTVTPEMIDIATNEALSRTWQDNNKYTEFVLNIRKGLNNINVRGYGLGDVLVPFAKTPANLTKALIDYSPAGLIPTIISGKNLKNSLSNGQYNAQLQHQFVQNLGKATAGTMLYVLGYALAKSGVLSGESDEDKDVANLMKNTLGVNSYSIKIGDKSFTYDWAQPVAGAFSIMANLVNKNEEEKSLTDKVLSTLDTAGNLIFEQSFMESINTVLNNNDGVATGIKEAVLELPSRAVPTFMKQITDMVDGTQRTTFEYDKPIDTMINKVKAKIPGLSQTLAPSVDTLGREIQKYGGKNNIFNVFLNPANVSTENISESASEIYRLYKQTGDKTIMPRVAPYYINSKGKKVTLSAKEKAQFQTISGQIIEENLANLMKTEEYKNMSDENKADIVNKLVGYSYSKAQNQVVGTAISKTYQKLDDYVSSGGNLTDYYVYKNAVDGMTQNGQEEYLATSNLDDNSKTLLYENVMLSNFDDEKKYADYKIAKNSGIDINSWLNYSSQQFQSDKTTDGKTIKNSRLKKVFNFVNSLSLSVTQKALLIKMQYPSFKQYDRQIVEFVSSNYSTIEEKATILKQLGFKIISRNGKVYVGG